MASKVTIDLDLAVVQRAISAKVQPAVEKILEEVDLPSRIATALLAKPPKSERSTYHSLAVMWGYERPDTPLIENLIDNAISEAARAFISKSIAANQKQIEAAFKKMMADSSSAFAKTLLDSLNGAMKDEWRFELTTKVSPKERERYD